MLQAVRKGITYEKVLVEVDVTMRKVEVEMGRVLVDDLLVAKARLKIGQRCATGCAEGHDLQGGKR